MGKHILQTLLVLILINGSRSAEFDSALEFLQTSGKPPQDYVLEKFDKYDIILLGEDHAVRNNLVFVTDLIPDLYECGVRNLGMEFGASEMQPKLDSLLSAPEYSPQLARDMMFFYNVGWPYQEYMDVYEKVWNFNHSLPVGAPLFRVVNLSYQYRWERFGTFRTPESMAATFYKGTPDKYRSEIVSKEVIQKSEKILLLVGLVHAFARYETGFLQPNSDNFCAYDDGWLGNRLLNLYPENVFSMMLHMPFGGNPIAATPGDGKLEMIMELHGNTPCGFDLIDTPMGRLEDHSSYSVCHPDFTLEQLFDGYIFLAPVHQLKGCTVDEDFYTGRSWQSVIEQYPDPDWIAPPQSLDEYLIRIRSYADLNQRYAGDQRF